MNKSSASKIIEGGALSAVLSQVFSPLVNSLDLHFGARDPSLDTGHQTPSQRDTGLRIFIDSILRQTHRQLRGDIKSRTGVKIDNTIDRLNNTNQMMAALQEKYANDQENLFADPEFFRIAGLIEVNEARYEAYNAVDVAFRNLYKEITGEDWKFTELTASTEDPRSERNKQLRQLWAQRFQKTEAPAEEPPFNVEEAPASDEPGLHAVA